MGGKTNLKAALVMAVFLAGLAPAVAAGKTIYVDVNTPYSNDGSSWARAYKYLQDGLAGASSGDEIWVAEGTYKPDANSADPNGSDDRAATFTLINGVEIYGGFAPGSTWLHRDPDIYETILSGDINTPGDANDNSYHVVTGSGVDPNAIIDGFTITGGNANRGSAPDDRGGGMYNHSSSPTVIDCTFNGNSASISGGGMHNEDGSAELEECTFTNNTAQSGGGMYNDSFHDPAAGNRVILTDCIFSGNSSLVAGGGIYNLSCDSILTACTFKDNSTVPGATGGGGICNDRSLTTLTNCTFSGNQTSSGSGGGVYNREISEVNVVGCVFTGNSAYYYGCGMYNRGNAMVVNCTFSSNSGALYTHSKGGGIADYYGDSLTVVNCIFSGNSAGFGGGMLNRRSDSVSVVNCTFSGNSATLVDKEGGGIYNRDCDPVITNCIIWGNIGDQIYNYDSAADPNVTYSCVQGSYPGTGNISSNPMFASSDLRIISPSPCIDAGNNDALPRDSLDVDDDGDTSELIPFDLGFKLRRVDDPAVEPDTGAPGAIGSPVVDMGAYEVSPIFVDDNASSSGDGRSWTTAYKYLQDALYAAADPLSGMGEIRVAQGTYYPDQDEGGHVTPADREATFEMQNNLAIRGGYRGPAGGGSSDDRNITVFKSILSGDYANDDDPNDPNSMDENSYHVMISQDTDDSAILDGFTIAAGNANGEIWLNQIGGGMYNDSSNPMITNCAFSGNSVLGGGGGMYNDLSSPTVTNCTFSSNSAAALIAYGGGMRNWNSNPILTNCTFIGNFAGSGGGGIMDGDGAITNCTFIGNSATNDGGAMAYTKGPITNCTFIGNSANDGGGLYTDSHSVALTNCTLIGNSASNYGGGLYTYSHSHSVALTNCIFWGNTAGSDGNEIALLTSTIDINYCDVKGGQGEIHNDFGTINWGSGNIDADPMFFDANNPDPNLRDYHLRPSSPCIDTGNNDADTDASTPEIEPLPDTDLDGRDRFADGDCNDTNIVDMGAYEFTYAYIGDFDSQCDVDFVDFAILANYWLTDELLVDIAPTPAGDGIIDERDLGILCDNWLFGK